MTNGEASGQAIADEILKRIALRYKNCMVNIYPDLPELTPVEGVLRCAMEEGFVLAEVGAGDPMEQFKRGRLFGIGIGLEHSAQIVDDSRSTDEHVNWVLKKLAERIREQANVNGIPDVLAARPDVAGGASAEQAEQDKIGRLTGGKCIEALASRREIGGGPSAESIIAWEAIKIVENEPLGYLTERDHEVLENFADRIVAKLQARAALAGERAETP